LRCELAGSALLAALSGGCLGVIGDEPLQASALSLQLTAADVPLARSSGFADERGGGVFVSDQGQAVRLRIDGSQAPLESHPGNASPPGRVRAVFPAGAYGAWVAADNGLYSADSGWLVELPWRDTLAADGVLAAAVGGDGVAWIAHRDGLFQLQAGELSELKAQNQSLRGARALAVAPAPDGSPALWFTQGSQLRFARQTARSRFEVSDSGLDQATLANGILALGGLSASADAPGELWLITPRALFRFSAGHWDSYATAEAPRGLVAAGRFVWLLTGDTLYRYDADQRHWGIARELTLPVLQLLAADASGSVWCLGADGKAFLLRSGAVPRALGLFESERVYDPDLQLSALLMSADQPSLVRFTLDDGERIERSLAQAIASDTGPNTLDFSLGGFDSAGTEASYSLAALSPGWHTLSIGAQALGGEAERRVHFEYRASMQPALSFASDVQPIYSARCAKCHDAGPGHALSTYEEWLADRSQIVRAVVELRMPADGPLEPAQIETVQRWAAGGAAP
jgi:hypothetical protein